jgi:hypothetical protein
MIVAMESVLRILTHGGTRFGLEKALEINVRRKAMRYKSLRNIPIWLEWETNRTAIH